MKILTTSILVLLIPYTAIHGNSHELDIFIHVGRKIYKEYKINDNKIEYVHAYDMLEDNKILSHYSRKLSSLEKRSLIEFIEKCDLEKLERRYINRNVEDGISVRYIIKVKGAEYKTYTSNFYHPTLISICKKINELLPSEYHMLIPSKTAPGMMLIDQERPGDMGR